jgi:hypothetical protein
VLSGWVSRVRRQGRAVVGAIAVWGLAMAGFGGAVGLAPHARSAMLVTSVVMLVIGGAADMASAAFRTSMLQSAASDDVRGRLQGVFIVVVAGGPRIADVVHGGAAASVGTATTAAVGGVLVVVLLAVSIALVPSFYRFRTPDPEPEQIPAGE